MIKKIIRTAIALVAVSAMLVSCVEDELWKNPQTGVRDGYIALKFSADIPAMHEVVSRSVDPDGGGVQDMTLFCFDSYGLFITTATATLASTEDLAGTFSTEVPDNTRTVHFLANQNMAEFKEDHFRNKSESEVMAVLEGSSGRMTYWARFACDPDDDAKIDTQLSAGGNRIVMIRNHARISIDNPSSNEWIAVTGFAVCNTRAFGTVAPYHPKQGFDFAWPATDDPFVTLPLNDSKMSDITDVTTATSQYVFETENSADDPVSIIIRGYNPQNETEDDALYYRVMLIGEAGEQLLVRRNHHYKLHIAGALSFGQKTFADALEAAATNNVWISISDEVNEVEDQNYILTVGRTDCVVGGQDAGGPYALTYTLKGKNGTTISDSDGAEITWIDNRVARQGIDKRFKVAEDGVGYGEIGITLLPLGDNEKLEGTLLVKKGRLQRKIKVITVKRQTFTPAWVATQVYGTIDENNPTVGRSHITAMFTIPETCPTELFPMRVLITANDVDVRYESGMALTVVREGDEGYYGAPTEVGYKYLYTVQKAGVQRVYFENILSQEEGAKRTLTIEAEHFETMERPISFSGGRKSITVTGLSAYSFDSPDAVDFPDDEYILYRLVPQKKHANVQFDLQLRDKTGDEFEDDLQGEPFNAGEKDEFLLYSQYLTDYPEGQESAAGVTAFDCTFFTSESKLWWQQHNPQGGRMLMFKPKNPDNPTEKGKYSIYMYTNRAKSAEVVRIASNLPDYPAVLPADDANGVYGGNSYRSVTFELANYNPFRFEARVNGQGSSTTGDAPEEVTPLGWSYEPGQEVDIEIDVTSFRGTDGKSADPFGEAFEIYIDAPMLTIDEERLSDCHLDGTKLKADPAVAGRFIYTVEADREAERSFGIGTASKRDDTAGVNQSGERKRLPFRTGSIVSAGNIVISSDEEQVVFFAKTFSVSNTPIAGSLSFKDTDGTLHDVPRNAFVSFERVRNNSRIGSVTLIADKRYELRLRKEYEYNWYADEVELHYEDGTGKVYHKTYPSLANLSANPDIVLEPAAND